jgi:NAD+ kinase
MKVLIVSKKTALQRIQDTPLRDNEDISPIVYEAHKRHQACLDDLVAIIEKEGLRPWVLSSIGQISLDEVGFVVSVGGDGTLLSVSHDVPANLPLIGLNSDPKTSVGHLCSFDPWDTPKIVNIIKSKNYSFDEVTRMEVLVDEHQIHNRVLNEALFSHTCPAAMTRFSLMVDDGPNHVKPVSYRCSGVWIGTGAGSTGALNSAGGELMPRWSTQLQAVIREPYSGQSGGTVRGISSEYEIKSETEQATLYIDGPHSQVPVWYGDYVQFRISSESLKLVKNGEPDSKS